MSLACDQSEVVRIARAHLQREARVSRDDGALLVESNPHNSLRWRFVVDDVARCASAAPSTALLTRIDCRLHEASGVMWIGEVHVAPRMRGRGLGRRLVAAAEAVAEDLSARCVYVFPLAAARAFWQRLGYRAHRRMSRVMVKELACGE